MWAGATFDLATGHLIDVPHLVVTVDDPDGFATFVNLEDGESVTLFVRGGLNQLWTLLIRDGRSVRPRREPRSKRGR